LPSPTPTPNYTPTPTPTTPPTSGTPTPSPTEGVVQLQTSSPTISIGQKFIIQARVVNGTFNYLKMGLPADVYLSLSGANLGNEFYLAFDGLGNPYFSPNPKALVKSWKLTAIPWVDIAELEVPNDASFVGSYQFKAQLIPNGALPGKFGEFANLSINVTSTNASSGGN
jgi:hypothetical protein